MYHLSGVDRGEATVLLYENRASKIYAAIVDICARMTNTGKTLAREDKTNSFV